MVTPRPGACERGGAAGGGPASPARDAPLRVCPGPDGPRWRPTRAVQPVSGKARARLRFPPFRPARDGADAGCGAARTGLLLPPTSWRGAQRARCRAAGCRNAPAAALLAPLPIPAPQTGPGVRAPRRLPRPADWRSPCLARAGHRWRRGATCPSLAVSPASCVGSRGSSSCRLPGRRCKRVTACLPGACRRPPQKCRILKTSRELSALVRNGGAVFLRLAVARVRWRTSALRRRCRYRAPQ